MSATLTGTQAPVAEGTPESHIRVVGIREIVRQLNNGLGPTLVSALAGSYDPAISRQWARTGGPEPDPEAWVRLQLAHQTWTTVSSVEGEHVARLWFMGVNPWLDGASPVEAIKEMRARAVMGAATAMTMDGFSG